jgi:hypothetical protein
MTALNCTSRAGCGWPKLCESNGYCMRPSQEAVSSKDHLTPAQRIGRVIGDIDCAMVEINPQHHVWRVLKEVQNELLRLKADVGSPAETKADLGPAGAVVPVLMGGGAAPGVTFPAMRYMCTKHGLIPHQDCDQCKVESVQKSETDPFSDVPREDA